ncbi:hypothetical protein VKT23_006120 [Stygiomarasmius scandens]|uniref:Uncharacterized protein n=1 Tax=Marasmiellus scandens TaxID=2682957 RepID=A0ABR1JSL1_9AGAR
MELKHIRKMLTFARFFFIVCLGCPLILQLAASYPFIIAFLPDSVSEIIITETPRVVHDAGLTAIFTIIMLIFITLMYKFWTVLLSCAVTWPVEPSIQNNHADDLLTREERKTLTELEIYQFLLPVLIIMNDFIYNRNNPDLQGFDPTISEPDAPFDGALRRLYRDVLACTASLLYIFAGFFCIAAIPMTLMVIVVVDDSYTRYRNEALWRRRALAMGVGSG